MEKIEHITIPTNGINMHVASIGSGPAVLFLHGFPELWYSWRHQLLFLASNGFRALAPDLRGFGDTDSPPSPSSYTGHHLVGDLIGLLDHLGIDQVFLVGHDWGAIIAWYFCLFRPDRVKALVNLSVHYLQRHPSINFVDGFRALLGDNFYICQFQEPGFAEADFGSVDTATMLKKFLAMRDPEPPMITKEKGFSALETPDPLPAWLTEEDIDYYASKFTQTGFTGGFNYYRAFNLSWELTAAWTGAKIKAPVKFIVGEDDLVYHFPGAKEYIHGGGFKKDVPLLEEVVVIKGAAHFINQEKADEINSLIYDFINKF
ncbi:epoxide hydrolase A-like [Benincasa hispida]|uniref:epoxide hydrolase A-like n=1 Tax=Benincasa hispida TaxID=102211 RepID=UPI001901D3CB|nr:epoxide hydrolase A-like [Benincasa hispida]